jgi:hypothetical protein
VVGGEAVLVLPLAVLGGGLYLWWRRKSQPECGCDADRDCKAGGASCAIPDAKEPS